MSLSEKLRRELLNKGAVLVGYGDLSEIPENQRYNLPVGVCVAVKYPARVIEGIVDFPTAEYYEHYKMLNNKLDELVTFGAQLLREEGYEAVAKTSTEVGDFDESCQTLLPHKTVATRAGIGWIGKCALLVTEEYGSMIRISTILTNAPLETAEAIDEPRCGDCTVCQKICPGGAVSGKNWSKGMGREGFFDFDACLRTAKQRTLESFGEEASICGRCIAHCPHTLKRMRLENNEINP